MTRVFIDIGAHTGATARSALRDGFEFDRVVSVEPDLDMVAVLEETFAPELAAGRYEVAPVALSDANGAATLYGDNAGGGASLTPTKFAADARDAREVVAIDWPTFLQRYDLLEADLFVKMNCEGAEVAIVDSIVDSGAGRIRSMVIDYDIIKTPFGGWRKWRSTGRLRAAKLPFLLSETVFVKNAARGHLSNWLEAFEEFSSPPKARIPAPWRQVARIRYLEVVSALGVRHDAFKRRKRATPPR